MINATDSNGRIDTREVEYIALAAVCIAYLDGRISKHDLALYHTSVDHNNHQQRELFGDHPFFTLCDLLWVWDCDHSLPDELGLTPEQLRDHAISADNRLRITLGYQVQTYNTSGNIATFLT